MADVMGRRQQLFFTVTLLHNKQLVNKSIERKSSDIIEAMWSLQGFVPRRCDTHTHTHTQEIIILCD